MNPSTSTMDKRGIMSSLSRDLLQQANAELLEQGRVETIADYYSPEYVVHITGRDLSGGHALIEQVVILHVRAFSGISASIEVLAEQDDRIVWLRTINATHSGPFKGFPATHRPIVWREMVTSRFQHGRIVEEWFITDLAERLLLLRKAVQA